MGLSGRGEPSTYGHSASAGVTGWNGHDTRLLQQLLDNDIAVGKWRAGACTLFYVVIQVVAPQATAQRVLSRGMAQSFSAAICR